MDIFSKILVFIRKLGDILADGFKPIRKAIEALIPASKPFFQEIGKFIATVAGSAVGEAIGSFFTDSSELIIVAIQEVRDAVLGLPDRLRGGTSDDEEGEAFGPPQFPPEPSNSAELSDAAKSAFEGVLEKREGDLTVVLPWLTVFFPKCMRRRRNLLEMRLL